MTNTQATTPELGERTPAQFFFEVGFGACWAEAYIRNGETPPFPLTDGVIERSWQIAPETYDDHEEFDRYLALANEARLSRPAGDDGYKTAFYEIADMLDIPARPLSPAVVFETEMKPRLAAALSSIPVSTEPSVDAVERETVLIQVNNFLAEFATADLDEIAADGGVTVGMVFQQQARDVYGPRLIRAALSALPTASAPEEIKRALVGLLQLVEAIQQGSPESFIPSLEYDARVVAARAVL